MPLPAPAADAACLVTGASSGIGSDIARELARRGHQVVLVARSEESLRSLADEINTDAVPAHVLTTHLSDRAARAALLGPGRRARPDRRRAGEQRRLLHAGQGRRRRPGRGDGDGRGRRPRRQDLCTRVLPGMVERGRGAVLNVASTGAFQPPPGQASYAAAKSFVLSYTLSLAGELSRTGATVTCLCSGPVKTGFAERAGFEPDDFDSALPKVMWVTSEEVARCAVKELDRGSLVAIPRLANQVGAKLSRMAPQRLLLEILKRMHPALR